MIAMMARMDEEEEEEGRFYNLCFFAYLVDCAIAIEIEIEIVIFSSFYFDPC